jgi:hypothetical protein
MKENLKKDTLVVNLLGGPGIGKSTMCAHVFAKLKWAGVDAEMALEEAKSIVWEGNLLRLKDQLFVSGIQHYSIFKLLGKVDVVITDSPIMLGTVYMDDSVLADALFNRHESMRNINFFINRRNVYNTNGRLHDEIGACKKDDEIRDMMNNYSIPYYIVDGTEDGVESIFNIIIDELDK